MVRISRKKMNKSSILGSRGAGGTLGALLGGNHNGAASLGVVAEQMRRHLSDTPSWVGTLTLVGVAAGFLVYMVAILSADSSSAGGLRKSAGASVDRNHPNLQLDSEEYDAIALDILQTLDCHNLLNATASSSFGDVGFDQDDSPEEEKESADSAADGEIIDTSVRRRRLEGALDVTEEAVEDGEENESTESKKTPLFNQDDELTDGDPADDGGSGTYWNSEATGKHLFCLAAFASSDTSETSSWKEQIRCDATQSKQKTLLDLWSAARGEFSDPATLKRVLEMSWESVKTVVGKQLNLWAPHGDTGLDYMISHVNDNSKTVDLGGLYGLEHNLGTDRLFVDVGSCLGTTSMAMSILYPGTKIVSIEVAPPNWLLQEMNWRCNADTLFEDPDTPHPQILLSGVGPAQTSATFARYMWKPDQVTATRSWTPRSEIVSNDIEINVKLHPWHSLLATAEVSQKAIDVLNVDCGACEYNLIPSLSDKEFNAIHTVMGGVHWGYIPKSKKPSSARGKNTHERLCQHENFARTAKECCQYPDMEVISSYRDHVLVREEEEGKKVPGALPKPGTVRDVAEEFCADFEEWSKDKHLDDIASDWGWFQLTPYASDEPTEGDTTGAI